MLVAMSGGVDSSVAAALLHEDGVDVVGVWMRLHDVADTYSESRRSCCSLDAAEDARRVAGQLGIPFFILNLEAAFGRGVLEPFLAAYQAGETPSPCVDCNSTVKFGALLGRARHLYGCDAVATGHYARVTSARRPAMGASHDGARHDGPRYRLLAGCDPDKDQSYFLYGLGQAQLAHTRFPLGALAKPEVRAIARRAGLATADKADSQEICFVPGGDYRAALRDRAGWAPTPGPLLDVDGRRLGQHGGAAAYTVGQRQGLGVAVGEPRYVARIDAATNVVQLGRREDLQRRTFTVRDVTFVAGEPPADDFWATVRIRHRAVPVPAHVTRRTDGAPASGAGARRRPAAELVPAWDVIVDQPVWAPAPGQAAVFYAGDEVLGGGRITPPLA